ncbi:MAG: PEP-CTERM sorting domain-containing protein [Verrucomicrobiota bacterium]
MKKTLMVKLALFAVAIMAQGVYGATIINFDEFEIPGTGTTGMQNYTKAGFTIQSGYTDNMAFQSPNQSHPKYYGSANLVNSRIDSMIYLTSASGAFTINSIDVHMLWPQAGTATIDFYINGIFGQPDSWGVSRLSFAVPDVTDWHTINFGSDFQNITSIAWCQAPALDPNAENLTFAPSHSFDNIVLNETAVPEPASLLLFGVAVGVFAFFKRRS